MKNSFVQIDIRITSHSYKIPQHFVGKWDVGYVLRHCLPTYRGYVSSACCKLGQIVDSRFPKQTQETFLGYYTACTSDYWLHGAPGDVAAHGTCNDIDFHDSAGDHIAGATMSGPGSVNGTYDQVDAWLQRCINLP